MSAELHTPVLLLTWRRPEHTKKVLSSLRRVKPKHLYVSSDGYKGDLHDARIDETRKLLEADIDWDCEVRTKYNKVNLGCRLGVASAIDWFFSNVESGIIIEDDILADPSFFFFCQELLERYSSNLSVGHITGLNYFPGSSAFGSYSYSTANLPHIWGWATWRRAWNVYDRDLETFEILSAPAVLAHFSRKTRSHLLKSLQSVSDGLDTWDYQWAWSCAYHKLITIVPRQNLVTNIGFDSSATHTFTSIRNFPKAVPLNLPLNHPRLLQTQPSLDSTRLNMRYPSLRNYFNLYLGTILGRFKFKS